MHETIVLKVKKVERRQITMIQEAVIKIEIFSKKVKVIFNRKIFLLN